MVFLVKKIVLFIFFSLVLFINSCASSNVVIVDEALAPQVIAEFAYEEFNKKNYKRAIAYYELIIERFDKNVFPKEVAWAYYEIGFTYYYQNKFEKAIPYFDIVLMEFSLRPARILAREVLDTIYEKKPKLKPVSILEEVVGDTLIEDALTGGN